MSQQSAHIYLGEMDTRPRRHAQHRRRSSTETPAPAAEGKSSSPLPLQLFICAAAVLMVLGMKYVDVPLLDDALQGLKIAVSAQSDADTTLGRLRFVTNLFPQEATAVFATQNAPLALPIEGSITAANSEAPYAVEILCAQPQPVKAAADGRVFYAGSSISYGTMVRLVHADGYETIYTGLEVAVRAGDVISAGQTLGQAAAGSNICFMVYRDGTAVPAVDYLTVH